MNNLETNIPATKFLTAIRDAETTTKTGASASAIGKRLGLTKQGVHKRLVRLEQDGMVEKLSIGYGLTKIGKRLIR